MRFSTSAIEAGVFPAGRGASRPPSRGSKFFPRSRAGRSAPGDRLRSACGHGHRGRGACAAPFFVGGRRFCYPAAAWSGEGLAAPLIAKKRECRVAPAHRPGALSYRPTRPVSRRRPPALRFIEAKFSRLGKISAEPRRCDSGHALIGPEYRPLESCPRFKVCAQRMRLEPPEAARRSTRGPPPRLDGHLETSRTAPDARAGEARSAADRLRKARDFW